MVTGTGAVVVRFPGNAYVGAVPGDTGKVSGIRTPVMFLLGVLWYVQTFSSYVTAKSSTSAVESCPTTYATTYVASGIVASKLWIAIGMPTTGFALTFSAPSGTYAMLSALPTRATRLVSEANGAFISISLVSYLGIGFISLMWRECNLFNCFMTGWVFFSFGEVVYEWELLFGVQVCSLYRWSGR